MAFSTRASQDDSYGSEIASGMESLVSLVECLPHAETDPGKHEKMKGHGKCALEKMMAMKQALGPQKSALNSQIGDLHVKKRELKDEEKENTRNLSQLAIQMEYQENIYSLLRQKLTHAENHLEELVALLKKARKEEKCSKVLTSITLVLLPLCTLMFSMEFFQEALKITDTKEFVLSAAIVTIICQVSMYLAQKAALELRKTISQYKVQVSDYQQEVSMCYKEMREIKKRIEDTKASLEKIKETGGELTDLSAVQKKQEELLNHINFVSKLTDKVDAVVSYIDDPSDFEYACLILDEIRQLVLSEVEKREQGSLRFPDRETIKKLIEKLKCGSKA